MIGIGIPTVGAGIRYLEFYIENLLSLAAHPEQIRIYVTYHTKLDRKAIEVCSVYEHIYKAVYVQGSNEGLFWPSVNHSSAVNALASEIQEETVIFSDYDMAFLKRGWDKVVSEKMEQFHLIGTPYVPVTFNGDMNVQILNEAIPWLKHAKLIKYQKLPNLTFMAIRKNTLDTIRDGRDLTNFGRFLMEGGLPFRLINSKILADENNIPLGSLQWMDTGLEIPAMIEEHQLSYEVFGVRSLESQGVLKKDLFTDNNVLLQPEFFYLEDEPFLMHFKKGTIKLRQATRDKYDNQFVVFKESIDEHIRNTDKTTPRLPVHS